MHGGIYDQLGGGFARYAVDPTWLIPHFEKMLYDNALLARAYLHGWQVMGESVGCSLRGDARLGTARNAGPGGLLLGARCGVRGRGGTLHVWDEAEMRETLAEAGLGADSVERVLGYWGVSATGNFEGKNILHVPLGARASNPRARRRPDRAVRAP